MANKTNLGRIVPVPVGTWSAATTYSKLDIVSYTNGSSYISKKDSNVNHNPATSSEWWQLLAAKGEKGQDGGGALSDTNPSKDSGTQGSAGTSSSVSRADHVHPLQVDDNIARKVDTGAAGTTGDAGSSEYYARADHAHPANVTNTKPVKDSGTTGNVGSKSFYARSDHAHPFQVDYDANYKPGSDNGSGVAGTSNYYARSDHAHPFQVDNDINYKPSQDTANGNGGSASFYARSDHAHPLNVSTTIPPQDTENGSDGASEYYARADHAHPLNVSDKSPKPVLASAAIAATTTPLTPDLIGSVGTSSAYARADHVHPIGFTVIYAAPSTAREVGPGGVYRTKNDGESLPTQPTNTNIIIDPLECGTISGYMPIGIVGVNTSSSIVTLEKMEIVDNKLHFNVHNFGTKAVTVQPHFNVLYVNTAINTKTT